MPSVVQVGSAPPVTLGRGRSNHLLGLMPAIRALSLVVLLGIAVLVTVSGPVAGLLAVAVLAAIAVAVRCPEYGLAFGAVATLAGGSFGFVAAWGGLFILAGACISGAALLARGALGQWRRLLLPALLLAWLGLRVTLEGDTHTLADVLRCLAVLVLALDCVQRGRNLVWAMSIGGTAFIIASAVLGEYDPTGARFEGISGNPNRMTFGLLLLIPFLCALALSKCWLAARLSALAALTGAVILISRSGSSQGVVGLIVVAIVLTYCWTTRWPTWSRVVGLCVGLATVVLVLGPALVLLRRSPDLMTLSGRTLIYAAALDEIARSPLVGSGRQHFSGSGVFDRSAHSVVLALAVTGGVILGLAWVGVLVALGVVARRMAKAGDVLTAVPVVIIVEQFVQTIHLVPFSWAMIGILLLAGSPSDLRGAGTRGRRTGEVGERSRPPGISSSPGPGGRRFQPSPAVPGQLPRQRQEKVR